MRSRLEKKQIRKHRRPGPWRTIRGYRSLGRRCLHVYDNALTKEVQS